MYFLEKFTEPLLRSLRPRGNFWGREAKFWISSIYNGFSFRIFVILSFEVVWFQRPRRPQKGLREFSQKLHFWNQCVPTKKMRYVTILVEIFTKSLHRGGVRWFMIHNKNNTPFINQDTFKVEFAPKQSPRKLKYG